MEAGLGGSDAVVARLQGIRNDEPRGAGDEAVQRVVREELRAVVTRRLEERSNVS
jgi:hypothetical protein